ERLEPELLEALGLVQQHKQFHKRVIRANTVLLYKQQKFNLLREESEGYSKLIVELSSNLPRTLSDIWDQEGIRDHKQLVHRRGELVHDRAEVLLKDIKSLIGYFDLDPNRVLDLILDVFTANLVDQWDLYLELLNLSPWRMRTKPAAGKQNGEMDEDDTPGRGAVGDGHPVFGQILGFKFSFYNSPDCTVSTPIQLYMVSAILIKNNLVKLEDLYPHLAPDDAGVENEFIEFKKSLAKMEREAGRSKDNAVSRKQFFTSSLTVKNFSLPMHSQKKNQKAGLVNALIQIGAMVHAKKILDRLPQIVQMYSDIPRHMCRHIHEIIEPMYKMHRPADTKFTVKPAPRREDYAPPLNVIDHDWIQPYQKVYVGRKLHPTRYTFFYDRWKESLPTNITDMGLLLRYLKGLLLYVGQNLHLDISLLGKLIRLGRAHLKDDDDEGKAVRDSWISIIAKYFLPALSQVYANPGITQELWSLMKLLPYETRYGLYAEWEHRTYDQVPLCRIAKVKCIAEVQRIMRRLTKDNVKQYGRHIGKVVHSNPVIAFTKILDLLRNYDNQIPHVVDAARYLTDLEFDILSFCLIETLSNPYDSRLKDDGTSLAKWLMSLSLFTGTLCRKHPIELQGILQFMARQLLNDNVYDIVVLQDIISQMTGMRSIDDPTDAQLDSLAGGEHLKREALMLESTKLTRKPTQRLMKALQDSELVSVIGIMLGQQRKEVVFREHGKELKVSGSVLDHCHRMLVQYFEFLSTYMDKSLYAAAFPDISELCIDYGLEPEVAFHILRPKLQYLMKNSSILKDLFQSDTGPEKLFTTAPGTPLPDTPGGEGINLKSSSDSMDVDTPTKPDNNPESLPTTSCLWERGLHDTILAVNNIVPPHVWKGVTPQFYTTFWQLSLFDIYVPETRYSAEIERQETLIKQLESDKSDNSNAAVQKRKKDKERFLQTVTMLQHERKVQIANYVVVKARLQREKDGWFATAQTRADCIINLMQYCLFPRCLFSPSDATYCAKLVYLLHELGTPNFSSLSLYDRVRSEMM
ncbi:transcription factor/nuclear export subunit protein 2-domain-containing protein, partial [Cladochytrium replicatum]